MFGAVRLARFNIETDPRSAKTHFSGLPIPMAGACLVATVLAFKSYWLLKTVPESVQQLALGSLSLLVSIGMVSSAPYVSARYFRPRELATRPWRAILLFATLLVVIWLREMGVLVTSLLYLLSGPLVLLFRKISCARPS
jgi:phosphatidylserine synthase